MKRIDTLTEEAKAVYLKALELAKVYGRSEYECGILDCAVCPFNNKHASSCIESHTADEWRAWAEEEV